MISIRVSAHEELCICIVVPYVHTTPQKTNPSFACTPCAPGFNVGRHTSDLGGECFSSHGFPGIGANIELGGQGGGGTCVKYSGVMLRFQRLFCFCWIWSFLCREAAAGEAGGGEEWDLGKI
jgi:hypothetical protein